MITKFKPVAKGVSTIALALALGACQMLGLGEPRVSRAVVEPEAAAMANFGQDRLQAGRDALTEGRTMDAINAFMLAKAFENERPAAYNGLAVAYSRLGREDLAERFFLTAVALSPDDTRYRSNLALFYVRQGLPRDGGAALAMAPVTPAVGELPAMAPAGDSQPRQALVRPMGSGIVASAPVARLQRVSRAEVRIGGASEPSAPVAGRRAVIEVGNRTRQPAGGRMAAVSSPVEPSSARPAYPIRIPLRD